MFEILNSNIIISLFIGLLVVIVLGFRNNRKKVVKSKDFYKLRQLFGWAILAITLLLLVLSSEKVNTLLFLISGLVMGSILGIFSASRFKNDRYELTPSKKFLVGLVSITGLFFVFNYGPYSDLPMQSKLNIVIILCAFVSGIALPVGYLKHRK